MPRSFVVTILCLFVTVSSIPAEDTSEVEQLKTEVKALKEEVQLLKDRVARSIDDQKKIAVERDRLKTELQELKKKTQGSEEETGDKSEVVPLLSKWKGKITTQNRNGAFAHDAEVTIVKREDNSFTMEEKNSAGVIWEWDCEITKGTAFKVVSVRRIKGADFIPLDKQGPLDRITGGGSVKGNVLRMAYRWPNHNFRPDDMTGELNVKLVPEKK